MHDVTQPVRVPLHGERVPRRDRGRGGRGGRRLVHGAAPADVRRAHAVGRRVPGRGRRGVARREREPRLLRVLHRGRAAHRRDPAHGRARLQRGVGGDRHAAGVRARVRVAVREPLRRLPQRRHRAAVRELSRHHRRAGRDARGRLPSWRVSVVLAVVYRPLFFASVDPDVASARGVRARLLSTLFLVVLGVAVAEAAQITGALLVFALLVVPGRGRAGGDRPPGSRASRSPSDSGSAIVWSGSRSRTTRRIRSGSGSRRSRS